MTKYKSALKIFLFSLLAVLVATAPALAGGAAPGESIGGSAFLGGGTDSSITITAPADISGFLLIPGQNNLASGILNVTADGGWSVTVSDVNATTAGMMTEYYTNNNTYVDSNPAKLASSMLVKATGDNVTLPTGGQIAGGSAGSAVTGVDIPITFTQPVSWTDPVSNAGRGYKIVVTFTGSLT